MLINPHSIINSNSNIEYDYNVEREENEGIEKSSINTWEEYEYKF